MRLFEWLKCIFLLNRFTNRSIRDPNELKLTETLCC